MDRAEFEKQKVIHAPFAIELAAAAKAAADLIKKAPPEARPVALAAADALVLSLRAAADAFVEGLPEDPNEVGASTLEALVARMRATVESLSATAPPSALLPALELIESIEAMVDTFGDSTPTTPHAFTRQLIDEQADFVEQYLNENALE